MRTGKHNTSIQTRREFFKETAKKVLPILAGVMLTPVITGCDKDLWDSPATGTNSSNCGCGNDCSGACSGGCSFGCSGGCKESCQGICYRSCRSLCGDSSCSSQCYHTSNIH